MADVDYDDEGWARGPGEIRGTEGRGIRSLRLVNGAGALTSLALVLGLGVWGYKLAVRDVNGVPVIRALAGPARMAPLDPGGELADHQGLAVNAIAAEGAAAKPAERLALAPRPIELAPEDQPMADIQVAGMAGPESGQGAGVPPAEAAQPQPGMAAPVADGADTMVADTMVADDLVAGDLIGADPVADALAGNIPQSIAIPADIPGVARSIRPQGRPAMLALAPEGSSDPIAEAAAAAVAAALSGKTSDTAIGAIGTSAALPTSIEPTSARTDAATTSDTGDGGGLAGDAVPAGTRLAQLGAFQTADEARSEWDKTMAALGPLMQGKKRVIETAQSGGRTFYRLRVQGFADLADARRFCAALKAEGRMCTPAQAQG